MMDSLSLLALISVAFVLQVAGNKLVQSPDKCLEPPEFQLKMDWVLKNIQEQKGWYISHSSKLYPALENPCESQNFLDHGEGVVKKCGTAFYKTPEGEEETRWACSFNETKMSSKKCVMTSVKNTTNSAAISFRGTVQLVHSDHCNYVLAYGCQFNKDKTKVQHRWWAVTPTIPLPEAAKKDMLDKVEMLGFDKDSYECSVTTPTCWNKMKYGKCDDLQGRKCWTCMD